MAINVNNVYRVVLAVLNRENRGFLTPDQFNRLGRQAQLDLLEKSFVDYEKYIARSLAIPSNFEYADLADKIKEKIDYMSKEGTITFTTGIGDIPTDNYRIVNISTQNRTVEVEQMTKEEATYLLASKLISPEEDYPAYYKQGTKIHIFPKTITSATVDYIQVPTAPVWGYTGDGYSALSYDSNTSTDFMLHPSDEKSLVIKILALAGVIVKDPTVIEVAIQKEAMDAGLENSQ